MILQGIVLVFAFAFAKAIAYPMLPTVAYFAKQLLQLAKQQVSTQLSLPYYGMNGHFHTRILLGSIFAIFL